jgi:hypothetical protein
MKRVDFETFCSDGQLIGESISKPWATFYRAIEGLPLDEESTEIFRACTGRDGYEPRIFTEATAIAGRRSEKTSTCLKFFVWKILTDKSWASKRNEELRIPIICQDMRIARSIKKSAESYLMNSPLLRNEVAENLASEIRFKNGTSLVCYPASWRSTRGISGPGAILDELAFVAIDGANDVELVRQVKPIMIRFGGAARLLKLSTPWQKSGVIYDELSHRDERDDLLVWQAGTAYMTPRVSRELLEKERQADPVYFAREYEAIFTDDSSALIPAEDINLAVRPGVREQPFVEALKSQYVACADASGLSGKDSFTFGIGHKSLRGDQVGVSLDLLRGWSRRAVKEVVTEISLAMEAFSLKRIYLDQFGFSFLQELLAQRGIEAIQMAWSSANKAPIFLDLKLALAQGNLKLLQHEESLRQLRFLESKKTSGGAFLIGAPRGQHDDYASTIAMLNFQLRKNAKDSGCAFLSIAPQRGNLRGGFR